MVGEMWGKMPSTGKKETLAMAVTHYRLKTLAKISALLSGCMKARTRSLNFEMRNLVPTIQS